MHSVCYTKENDGTERKFLNSVGVADPAWNWNQEATALLQSVAADLDSMNCISTSHCQ